MLKRVFILSGPPGSGKGTQAELLRKKFGLDYISLGDSLRELLAGNSQTKLMQAIRRRYQAGVPQPDALTIKMIEEKMRQLPLKKGIIFDAFPLSLNQAKVLERILKKFKLPPARVLYLNLSLPSALRRLGARRTCPQCHAIFRSSRRGQRCPKCGGLLVKRKDDASVVIRYRFREYKKRLQPVIDFYRKEKRLFIINGEQSVPKIFAAILQSVS